MFAADPPRPGAEPGEPDFGPWSQTPEDGWPTGEIPLRTADETAFPVRDYPRRRDDTDPGQGYPRRRDDTDPGRRTAPAMPATAARALRPPPVAPVRSVVVALLAGLFTAGLILGAQVDRSAYAVVCLSVQALFVLAWTFGTQPPGPWVVGIVGIGTAAAANVAMVYTREESLAALGYVVAGGLVAGIVGQLARGVARARVTEALGATLVAVVAAAALATPILLTRYEAGTQALDACFLAAGVALVVARLCDAVIPLPRVNPQVPRGAIGVVAGAMAGTAVAAWSGAVLVGLSPAMAAAGGGVVGLVAVLADLGMGYAEAGRRLAGEEPGRWVVRLVLGPLVALAIAAPAAYLLSVLLIVRT